MRDFNPFGTPELQTILVSTKFGMVHIVSNKLTFDEAREYERRLAQSETKESFDEVHQKLLAKVHSKKQEKDNFEEIEEVLNSFGNMNILHSILDDLFGNSYSLKGNLKKENIQRNPFEMIFGDLINDSMLDKQIEFLQNLKKQKNEKQNEETKQQTEQMKKEELEHQKIQYLEQYKKVLKEKIQELEFTLSSKNNELLSSLEDVSRSQEIVNEMSALKGKIKKFQQELENL